MLLTISTTNEPATDLGFLLHKNPDRHHSAEVGFGTIHVIYPEATEALCTAALIVDVDPISLVRDRRGPAGNDFALAQYVNDRPYAASSFLSVALARVFGTAISGRSKERPDLADTPIPLVARLPVLPCKGGEEVLRRLFEPMGYAIAAEPIPLEPFWVSCSFRGSLRAVAGQKRLRHGVSVVSGKWRGERSVPGRASPTSWPSPAR
ncbi:MAG: hypothetical protein ACYCST_05885 [Acidimicrobiales bacterium]